MYILGVLTHTTAWDQHYGGDEALKCGFKIDYTLRDFALLITVDGKISPMDESVIRGKKWWMIFSSMDQMKSMDKKSGWRGRMTNMDAAFE